MVPEWHNAAYRAAVDTNLHEYTYNDEIFNIFERQSMPAQRTTKMIDP